MINKRVSVYSIYSTWVIFIVALYPVLRISEYKIFFFLIGAALYTSIVLSMGRKDLFHSIWTAPFVYAFLGIPFLSIAWSIQPSETLIHAVILVGYGSIFTICHIIFLNNKIEWFYKLVVVIPILYGVIFIGILLTFGTVRPEGRYVHESIGSISNHIPAIALPTLPYLYVLWKKGYRRGLVFICVLFLLFIAVISESRAAYGLLVGYCVLIPLFTTQSLQSATRQIISAMIIVAIVGGAVYSFAGQETVGSVIERFSDSQLLQGNFSIRDEDAQDFVRIVMISETANIIYGDPLTGIGYRTFKEYMISKYGFGIISHNILLTTWGEMGILGFITFLGVITGAFRKASRVQKRARIQKHFDHWEFMAATKAALVVVLLHALVRPQLTNPMLFIILAAPYGLGVREAPLSGMKSQSVSSSV